MSRIESTGAGAGSKVSMAPFQVFRLWCRRAPTLQKAGAITAAMAVLAALAWAVVPASTHGTSGSGGLGASGLGAQAQSGANAGAQGTSGTLAGGSSASGVGGVSTGAANSAGAATGARSSAGGGSASGHCVSPPGSATGVNATQIKIAAILVSLYGPTGNSAFGIPSPQQQQAAFQAVADNINANGGVACRKLVPQYYDGNDADQAQLQQLCLTISQAGVYAVLDLGAYAEYPAGMNCYAQNHIPLFEAFNFPAQVVQHLYPYIFAFDTFDSVYKNAVFGLKQKGFFSPSNGFKKFGILYRDCQPEYIKEEISWLNQAGIPSSEISSYDDGCPNPFASPSDIENAILQFKRDGVTNMTEVDDITDIANFTNASQSQGFNPKWGLGDDGALNVSSSAQGPNSSNMNNGIAITASRNGENNTPSLTASPTAGTVKCNAIMQTVGLSPVYNQETIIGDSCNVLWMFEGALDNGPSLSPTSLAAGLQRTGSIDFSFPLGPNNFTAPGTTYAGQYWRVDQYYQSCSCWKVVEPNFSPSF